MVLRTAQRSLSRGSTAPKGLLPNAMAPNVAGGVSPPSPTARCAGLLRKSSGRLEVLTLPYPVRLAARRDAAPTFPPPDPLGNSP